MTFKIDIEELIALLQREISCPDWPLLLSKTSSLFDIQQITDPPSNFISVEALLSYPAISSHAKIKRDIIQLLMDRQENPVKVKIHTKIPSYKTQSNLRSHNKIKNILAVVSGKGGVGKSTVTSYLALALQQEGARVGILDADIYGPSQPFLLGTEAIRPTITADKKFQPIIINGINMLSIGNLINENMPMIWRGPMVSKALQQLLYDTIWPDLDYLIVDLPPGTGDIQLTMAQKIPVSGAIIVTTSQDLSLLDAKKAAAMLEKVEISVLGIIENMSHFTCPNCQHVEAIFGSDLTKQWADKIDAPFLGSIPLHPIIRDATMQHKPAILSNKEHAVCEIYRQIARRVGIQLSLQERDLAVPVKLVSS